MADNIKLYAVMVEAYYEPPIHEWLYLDVSAAKAKFDELVAHELQQEKSYDYITLRAAPMGGDLIVDGEDVLVWNPDKHRVENAEQCKARRG